MLKANEISDILEMQLKEVDTKMAFEEVGTVMEVGDGVAHVLGWIMCRLTSCWNLRTGFVELQ